VTRTLDDRGEVAANTVVFVAVLALFFMVVQFGVIFTAQQAARSAARQALDAARLERGTAAQGEAAAQQFLERTNVLQDPSVTVDRGTETVTVTVAGEAWSPTPTSITVTMTAPLERVVE
jgi:type II secretory pathway pseudopilin PulG